MTIRVIAGTAKGRRLRMVRGGSTRPVRDQVKEALFNMLAPRVEGAAFLDLFAGTGSVGIEALSRGAARATFVESHPTAIETIRQNLAIAELSVRARLVQSDVFKWLQRPIRQAFDFVYVAPPQYSGLWSKAVDRLDQTIELLYPDAWVIAQVHPKEYETLQLSRLIFFDQRAYGKTLLVFYEMPGD